MAQNRTQSPGERQPRFFRNLNLIDPSELILDRIFNRDDFPNLIIDLIKRGVQRRGLPAAGGTGYQDDSVRQAKYATERFEFALIQTEFAHAAKGRVLPQQPQNYRFAVQHRNNRDANVHFAVVEADFDAAILRQPFLRDVEMAEDFYP